MENAALDPPDWLDGLVTLLIPPGAREVVIGDMHEYCVTSRQYAWETLRIAPFVIASQVRRNLNLPALIVQAGLVFFGLGGGATVAALPLLLLWPAYQPLTRPSPRDALRGALLMAFSGVVILLLVSLVRSQGFGQANSRPGSGLALFLLGMPLSPLLCGFRACLIIANDCGTTWNGTDLSMAELSALRRRFLRKTRGRNLIEGALMGFAGICWPTVMHWTPPSLALGVTCGIVALFLLTEFKPWPEATSDFISLRAQYGQELICQQQLRCFLWWLWVAPAFLTLQTRAATGQLTIMQCSVAMMLLGFVVTAFNREGEGRTREMAGALERARQRTC